MRKRRPNQLLGNGIKVKIAIWGRTETKLEAALSDLQSLGANADAFICDVTDESALTGRPFSNA